MKLALFLALIILWGTTLASTSKGEGVDESCDVAKALAINNALEQFSAREFEVRKRHVCKDIVDDITCFYQKEITSEVAGTFKQMVSQKFTKEDDLCFAKVVIEVEKSKLLDVEVLGKELYKAGDIFELTVRTKEPLYVYVYNDSSEGLQKLFPHLDNNHEIVSGSKRLEDHKHIRYTVYVPNPYEESKETIIVVFSKVKLTFKNRLSKSEFYDTIKAVPAFSRRVLYHSVVINRRSS